jgi:hypothetical protein
MNQLRIKVLEIAKAQVGIKESPAGSNKVKYNTWFYGKEVSGAEYPWCGTSVSWIFDQAEINLGKVGFLRGFAGCPYAVANVKKWGRIVTVPLPGDVTFYDWNGDGRFDHTGIFDKDLGGGKFAAYEGNTAIGNDSNGGEFMYRDDRKYKNAIFVRPNVYKD